MEYNNKNILILGQPRSGKTTLARMIYANSNQYSLISLDHLRGTFAEVYPELGISSNSDERLYNAFSLFVSTFLKKASKKDKNILYIIEGCDITFEKAMELFNTEDNFIVFMGKTELSVEEMFDNVRYYDGITNAWTTERSDEELKIWIKDYIRISCDNQRKCSENNILFLDTSHDYDKKIQELASKFVEGKVKK